MPKQKYGHFSYIPYNGLLDQLSFFFSVLESYFMFKIHYVLKKFVTLKTENELK